ncbi:MAG: hypothetical protein VX335_04125 [Pseudomonadota bacterium]|nr:hypothetical protein [Pseudomonadota bacterium]
MDYKPKIYNKKPEHHYPNSPTGSNISSLDNEANINTFFSIEKISRDTFKKDLDVCVCDRSIISDTTDETFITAKSAEKIYNNKIFQSKKITVKNIIEDRFYYAFIISALAIITVIVLQNWGTFEIFFNHIYIWISKRAYPLTINFLKTSLGIGLTIGLCVFIVGLISFLLYRNIAKGQYDKHHLTFERQLSTASATLLVTDSKNYEKIPGQKKSVGKISEDNLNTDNYPHKETLAKNKDSSNEYDINCHDNDLEKLLPIN